MRMTVSVGLRLPLTSGGVLSEPSVHHHDLVDLGVSGCNWTFLII